MTDKKHRHHSGGQLQVWCYFAFYWIFFSLPIIYPHDSNCNFCIAGQWGTGILIFLLVSMNFFFTPLALPNPLMGRKKSKNCSFRELTWRKCFPSLSSFPSLTGHSFHKVFFIKNLYIYVFIIFYIIII